MHLAAESNGKKIFHALRWCGRLHMQFWFTCNPEEISTEGAPSHFDARDVPVEYQVEGETPINWICRAVIAGFDLDSITNANSLTSQDDTLCKKMYIDVTFAEPDDTNPNFPLIQPQPDDLVYFFKSFCDTSVQQRIVVERAIIRRACTDLIAAGLTISVHDGKAMPLKQSSDLAAIMGAIQSSDEDQLLIGDADGKRLGMISLIYGNDGHDVIADNSVSLEGYLTGANTLADALAEMQQPGPTMNARLTHTTAGSPGLTQSLTTTDGRLVAYGQMTHVEAARLCACWNACDGIATASLEKVAGDTSPVFTLLLQTTTERDKLLAALVGLLASCENTQGLPDEALAAAQTDPKASAIVRLQAAAVLTARQAVQAMQPTTPTPTKAS